VRCIATSVNTCGGMVSGLLLIWNLNRRSNEDGSCQAETGMAAGRAAMCAEHIHMAGLCSDTLLVWITGRHRLFISPRAKLCGYEIVVCDGFGGEITPCGWFGNRFRMLLTFRPVSGRI
jgi:hypothetical protein